MRFLPLLVLCFVSTAAAADDFPPLFNGKDLTGWEPKQGSKPDDWAVVDGILACKAGTGWLGFARGFLFSQIG
jgi:hypothetical protein